MTDTVSLLVNNQRIENFKSYTISADMFVAGSAFTLELANPEVDIEEGSICELHVNGKRELKGVIDKPDAGYDKSGDNLTVTGRSTMGWVVDAHAEIFTTVQNYTLKSLAQKLLEKAPKEFINIKTIDYAENVKGRLKSRSAKVGIFDTTTSLSQVEPGMTDFEVLKEYAKSKGFIFYDMPDGQFVFGRPKATGDPLFRLVNRKDGKGNNILSGKLVKDISKRYSKITVVGQKQGQDVFTASQVNIEKVRTDPDFPFYKPYVLKDEYGGENPDMQARLLFEKMRHDGFRLQYTVAGHSQDDKNWSINELATVQDENKRFKLNGSYLIYGRTFEKSKDKGTITRLRIGLPGMMA